MQNIYLFGFKNAFNYGDKYVFAISFATLITDTQWDIGGAIKTVAQIDIAKKEFSYKEHMRNSMKLTYMLIVSANVFRVVCSFMPSPFCTSIGLVVSAIFQLVSTQWLVKKNKLNLEMKKEKNCELIGLDA